MGLATLRWLHPQRARHLYSMNDKTDWWTWPLMIVLSPIYLLIWVGIIILALVLLGIGIVMAGWEQVTRTSMLIALIAVLCGCCGFGRLDTDSLRPIPCSEISRM